MKTLLKSTLTFVLCMAMLLSSIPSVNAAVPDSKQNISETKEESSKVQLTYEVKYIDQATGESLYFMDIKKIGFSDEEETERAKTFSGYRLISDEKITKTLKKDEDNEFVFYYESEELEQSPVDNRKNNIIDEINSKKNIPDTTKKDLISRVKQAETEEILESIYDEVKNIETSLKVQVKYGVKYIDNRTGFQIQDSVEKIGFAYETVTEKADNIKGYKLLSGKTQSLVLDKDTYQTIVFHYEKLDLKADKEAAKKTLKSYVFISDKKRKDIEEKINNAYTESEIIEILKDAEELNKKSVKQVRYTVKHIDIGTGEVLKSTTKIDFQAVIVEEKALNFDDLGLISPSKQRIVLNPDKDNTIIFNYKAYDDPDIPLSEFLKKKIDYKTPLVYKDTDFTGRPDDLRKYLIRKIHNGDLYAKFTATKADQEKAYWDLFNKSTYAGNVRFARNWTDPKDTKDKNVPTEFSIGFRYDDNIDDMRIAENMMHDFVEKNIREKMSDLKKVQIIHDFILKKGTPALTKEKTSIRNLPSGRLTNSPVAFMLEGRAVCEGYAMAFNRMAEIAGVETIFVAGKFTPQWYYTAYRMSVDKFNERYKKIVNTPIFDQNINHAWNLVKIDGKWYHVDTYHDDFFSEENPNMNQEYTRFLKSDEFMIQKAGRYWNFNYTPESKENYKGKFSLITYFVE